MLTEHTTLEIAQDRVSLMPSPAMPVSLSVIPVEAAPQLARMFRDPRVLDREERSGLIAQLSSAVDAKPNVPELRVLLGMALSVDLQAQKALEHLRIAAEAAPQCFIARLKLGELLMRLRICDQAAEETRQASLLASNAIQSEMARRQAATIRTMLREGIERGGYKGLLSKLFPARKKAAREVVLALEGID